MNAGILSYAFRSLRFYLSNAQKKKALVMMFHLLMSSLLDVFSLASLIPVIVLLSEENGIQRNKYSRYVYQYFEFDSNQNFIIFLIVAIFIFFLCKNLYSSYVLYSQSLFTANIGLTIVSSQLNKYLNFPYIYFQDLGSAYFFNSVLSIPVNYVNGVLRPLFVLVSEIVIMFVVIGGILVYQPTLFIMLIGILAPTMFVTYKMLRNKSQQIGDRLNELRPTALALMNNLFNGFIELKLANKHNEFKNRLLDNQQLIQSLDAKSYIYSSLPVRSIEMVAIMGVLTILSYAVFFDKATELIPLVGVFAAAAYRLMPSVNRALVALVSLKTYQYAIEDIEKYRDNIYQENFPLKQLELNFGSSIALRSVKFFFPGQDKPALNNINLCIKKGDIIGFVGSSGSGKTTLMNIFLRFYREQEGGIFVDDVKLTDDLINSWYQHVGYIKQDTFLMETSIKDNITLGSNDVNLDRLNNAIKLASLEVFIQELPNGVDTMIGERGSKLSGGQRQRIGIARALYKNAQILILDEATSALDNQTEREVSEAIHNLSLTNITILIVAHRITTLRECNRIYELLNGSIIAEHQYSDLLEKILD